MKIIVLGATGVFGQLLVHELRGAEVIPASRATGTDMRDPDSIARLARGAFAVLCAAGPFQSFDPQSVRAAISEGAHWLDISDDPHWFFALLDDAELDVLARSKHVAVVPGLSSLPAISCALVRTLGARTSRPQSPGETRVTITLGIGNRNAKGAGSIASAMTGDGRTILTPDRELLRREGIDARTFVKFQLPGAALLFKLAKMLHLKPETLSRISAPFSRAGSDASYVEVVSDNGTMRVDARGQRLAILPIAILANRLIDGLTLEGVLPPHEAIADLLDALTNAACVVASTAS
ncbi:MAG TPA: hypothetical protein VJ901_01690 [Thermoanaerobaculia bacterium]|nr:hypothetical protein [Thermoanaerobaculia bacterium]